MYGNVFKGGYQPKRSLDEEFVKNPPSGGSGVQLPIQNTVRIALLEELAKEVKNSKECWLVWDNFGDGDLVNFMIEAQKSDKKIDELLTKLFPKENS